MKSANIIQCFMLSTIQLFYNNLDVFSLVSIQEMTSSYLCDLTKQVITNVANAVYTIIPDNNTTTTNNIYVKSNIQRYEFSGCIMIYTIIPVDTHGRNRNIIRTI